eukprot:7650486-Lingulodinium_polyedra.AAC.1
MRVIRANTSFCTLRLGRARGDFNVFALVALHEHGWGVDRAPQEPPPHGPLARGVCLLPDPPRPHQEPRRG